MFKPSLLFAFLLGAGVAGGAGAVPVNPASPVAPLQLTVFNPGAAAIFPVASVLVTGQHEAVLIDAQFARGDAEKLVAQIRASGKQLRTVYISHSDPDFYFGLDVIKKAFPKADIVATAETVAAIRGNKDAKLAYWGPILKDNAPASLVVPQVLKGKRIMLEGQALDVSGPTPARTYVWIPSIKTIAGGVVLSNHMHVWMADTQTAQSRRDWISTLDGIAALKPVTVVPGHFKPGSSYTPDSIAFTRNYVQTFEAEAARAADSSALINAMQRHYPALPVDDDLKLSAKVAKGEMKW